MGVGEVVELTDDIKGTFDEGIDVGITLPSAVIISITGCISLPLGGEPVACPGSSQNFIPSILTVSAGSPSSFTPVILLSTHSRKAANLDCNSGKPLKEGQLGSGSSPTISLLVVGSSRTR